ncbi:MAG: hypothetical protein JW912_06070 [Sedimentisphaerales bacterium]|nr:hypothetical protein [Sedimentisphaerales bacterium]
MKKLIILLLFSNIILGGIGCRAIGVISSPTIHEQKIPAEYKLAPEAKKGVLVFVDAAQGVARSREVIPDLTEVVKELLIKRVKVNKKYITSDKKLESLRARQDNLAILSPVQIGKESGSGMVLYILIEDYDLTMIDKRGYYAGSMVTRSVLFDVESGDVVWPADKQGKRTIAKFALETKGKEIAKDRLGMTVAHCVTRYLYDCPKPKFKASDEFVLYKEITTWD